MEKIWKAIPSYKGYYEVSNYGEVRSYLVRGTKTNELSDIPTLKNLRLSMGYPTCDLFGTGRKNKKTWRVHVLVAMAFLGHKPNGYNLVVNHIDNNPLNNRLDNLELINQGHNTRTHKEDVGVYWNIKSQKWFAMIRIKAYKNGSKLYLGGYENKEQALKVYQTALKHINEFENKDQFRKLVCDYDIMKY